MTEAILKALKASDQTDVEELAIAILQGVAQYAEVIADLPAGNTRGLLTALRERIGAHRQGEVIAEREFLDAIKVWDSLRCRYLLRCRDCGVKLGETYSEDNPEPMAPMEREHKCSACGKVLPFIG